jgi:hypothetical protein
MMNYEILYEDLKNQYPELYRDLQGLESLIKTKYEADSLLIPKFEARNVKINGKDGVKEVSSKIGRTNELLEKRFQRLEEEVEKIKKALLKARIEV